MPDNYEAYGPKPNRWKDRQAKWSIPHMTEAIKAQCQFCNQEQTFIESNDCVSHVCPLFPFRPGLCNPEVKGVARAARQKRASGGYQKRS